MPWGELFLAEFPRLEISPTIEMDVRESRANDDVEKSWMDFHPKTSVSGRNVTGESLV